MRRAGLALALLAASPLLAEDDPKTATEYVVKSGETLGGIANRVEVPRVLIIEANGLKAPYTVRAGQKLVIPRRRSHTVQDGETGLSIALDYGVPWTAIAAASGIDPKKPIKPGQKLVIPTIAKGAGSSPPPTPAPAPGPSP
ncbi:MAG TPA: LysM peptidoglycan-binding domain-containing protein, partial [Novosphingobium sp.]|nr:LysM peptidoglycan-binding domain-containing protein [Novosphingobium sp.]